jgi:hypothetical protein
VKYFPASFCRTSAADAVRLGLRPLVTRHEIPLIRPHPYPSDSSAD